MSEVVVFQSDDQFERWVEERAIHIETVAHNAKVEAGRTLREVQAAYKYRHNGDGFVAWLAARFPNLPQRSAYQMIDAAAVPVEMFANFANISLAAQAEIGRSDREVQDAINDRITAGEIFTAAQVKDLRLKMLADAAAESAKEIEDANYEIETLSTRVKELEADEADHREEIARLNKAIAEHAKLIEDARKSLPSPKQAEKLAAEKGDGAAVLGNDGRLHTGATAEQRRAGAAFMHFHAVVGELGSEHSVKPDLIAAGCTDLLRPNVVEHCQRAIAYITAVMDEVRK